ncbi:MAG: hypothetical protein ACJA06_002303, partial [Halocynthiibacter sp.]
MTRSEITNDHIDLSDAFAARRYFRKFEAITGHLGRVAATMEKEGSLSKIEVTVLTQFLGSLAATFKALSMKYLLTGRDTGHFFGSLAFDNKESGFPIHSELLTMANDAQQAKRHLRGMPSSDMLKTQMVQEIVGDRKIPTRLQFALSQRLYYTALTENDLFWAQNDPVAIWLGNAGEDRRNLRRRYLLSWAVYDSQI